MGQEKVPVGNKNVTDLLESKLCSPIFIGRRVTIQKPFMLLVRLGTDSLWPFRSHGYKGVDLALVKMVVTDVQKAQGRVGLSYVVFCKAA